jgi:hypothetical protein
MEQRIENMKTKAFGQDETLKELVDVLCVDVNWSETPQNIPGYCASDTNIFQEVVEYTRTRLNVPKEDVIPFQIDKGDTVDNLWDLIKRVQYETSERTLRIIAVQGLVNFEMLRTHWYDQCMTQYIMRRLEDNPPQNPKKIVVITNIGKENGADKFNKFKEEARTGSQHKRFYWEF